MPSQLRENLRQESIDQLPLREAIVVQPSDCAAAAAQRMRDKQLGCAVVVNDSGQAQGFFTERTLIELLLAGKKLQDEPIGDHLDPDWYSVDASDNVLTVYSRVVDRGARFICVLDDQGRPKGLTGQRGLAEYVAEHYPRSVMNQRIGALSKMEHREGG